MRVQAQLWLTAQFCTARSGGQRRRSVARYEKMPGAVRGDAEPVEGIGAEIHHILVVGAGDDAKKADLLLGGERLQRHAGEIGPQIDFLRRALVDVDEAGV